MEYFNAGGGGTAGNGAVDPYAAIPQQFGNGGQQQPQQNLYPEYQQESGVVDYETYQQQQQQYRGTQQSQPSPSLYYQAQMNQAGYFPIHSASEHDFLGPQQPAAGTAVTSPQNATPYQGRSGANKEFMIQHQQRRGNQSGTQQSQSTQQSGQQGQQNQSGRQQNQQQMQQQQQQQNQQQSHFMHQQMQAAQQQQAQQLQHRLHGAPINAQQFMVPPPTMIQSQQLQQAQQQQMHHMQQMHQQQQHPQMIQQPQSQQAYHPVQSNQQQSSGHHQQQHNQNQNQHHQNQNHPGHHHITQNHMMHQRIPLKDWPIRCVVESKYVNVITGENGSTIREIAQTCHCRVEFVTLTKKERMALGNNTDRILTVHGNAEQASKAVARVLDVIQTEALKDDAMVGADVVLKLRAHNQLCGRLIGKNGNSIKDIMQKTGTHITVTKYVEVPVSMGDPNRNGDALGVHERSIVIKGPSIEAVVQAESLISAKLKRCYESDIQLRAQTSHMPPVMMPPFPPPVNPMIPGAQLIPTPVGMMQIQHFTRSPHHQLTQNNTFLAPGTFQVAPGVFNLRQVRVWVPDNMIGALIGAKGKNIKMIIRDSGAAVKIEAPEEKAQREAEEAEKKQKKEKEEAEADEKDGAASGDQPQEFLEDNGTVTSSDAIEEKPKPVSERTVTITGDDLQLLKAQSFVFTKIAETGSSASTNVIEAPPILFVKLRTEVCVPTKIIGRIIGKGGQNVRELQRITGASVKIPEEERNGGSTFTHDDGLVEEMTMIRVTGNMYSTHNVQFRLGHLVSEYYRGGEHLPKSAGRGARPPSAPGKDASGLDKMDQLAQVPPLSNNASRTSPKTGSTPKSKSP